MSRYGTKRRLRSQWISTPSVPGLHLRDNQGPLALGSTTTSPVLDWAPAEPCNRDDTRKLANLYVPHLAFSDGLLDQVAEEGGTSQRLLAVQQRLQRAGLLLPGLIVVRVHACDGEPIPARGGLSCATARWHVCTPSGPCVVESELEAHDWSSR